MGPAFSLAVVGRTVGVLQTESWVYPKASLDLAHGRYTWSTGLFPEIILSACIPKVERSARCLQARKVAARRMSTQACASALIDDTTIELTAVLGVRHADFKSAESSQHPEHELVVKAGGIRRNCHAFLDRLYGWIRAVPERPVSRDRISHH